MADEVVLLSGVRTAVGKFGRAFRELSAPRLGAIAVKEAITRAGVRMEQVDEVIMGNVISAGLGQNPARQASISARGTSSRSKPSSKNKPAAFLDVGWS